MSISPARPDWATRATLSGRSEGRRALVSDGLNGPTESDLESLKVLGELPASPTLEGLASLPKLNLGCSAVVDDDPIHLRGPHGLESLFLNDTAITDAGLVHVAVCDRKPRERIRRGGPPGDTSTPQGPSVLIDVGGNARA